MAASPPVESTAPPTNPATAQLKANVAFATDIAIAPGTLALPTAGDVVGWVWQLNSDTLEGPETDAAAGLKVWKVPSNCNMALLTFFGTDADGETGTVFIATTRPTTMDSQPTIADYHPEPQALLTVTLGAKTGLTGGVIGATKLWADAITETTDYSFAPNGNRIVGPDAPGGTLTTGTNARVGYLIDLAGASHLCVWLRIGTAAGINCVCSFL